MKKFVVLSVLFFVALAFMGTASADDEVVVNPGAASVFAELPPGVPFPEGITADAEGNIYVGTFIFGSGNQLLKFDSSGTLRAQFDFGGEPLLGLAFNPRDNKVYICNVGILNGFGPSRIQRIDTDLIGPVEDVAIIASVAGGGGIGAPPDRTVVNPDTSTDTTTFGNFAAAPNALAFNRKGDLFVSDSFQGAVFKIKNPTKSRNVCPTNDRCVKTVAHDGLLATAGFPPFGANGIALSSNEKTAYVANTGDDRILAVDLKKGNVSVFVESINGADGLAYGGDGILWVAANQADQVIALDEGGRVRAKLGDFLRFEDGKVDGLLFPASLVIVGDDIFVTNLAFPLGSAPDEPEADTDLTTYTVSTIEIPDDLSD
ncbi:MAG: SMP-30/gluconolactonase/LRE family protein [Acidiferrobacterales bacterium]